jgi:type IV pilus assembly protein PilX
MSPLKSTARLHAKTLNKDTSGISLVIVLIFLVILSTLAVVAIQNSTFSARIAGNEADRTLAFQAAEAALRDAENDIRSLGADAVRDCLVYKAQTTAATTNANFDCRIDPIDRGNGFDTTCPEGRCIANAASPVWETATNWVGANSARSVEYGRYTGAVWLPVVSRQPRYMLEYFKQGDFSVYRVTAMGFGANDTTRAILQASIKAKPV